MPWHILFLLTYLDYQGKIYIEYQGINRRRKERGILKMAGEKGLLGGSIQLMLLALLSEKDFYGYQIIKELEKRSESVFQLKEGTLYPVLHRMQNQGLLNSYDQDTENGKRRKYYRITEKGRRQLVSEKEEWRSFTASVNRVIGGSLYTGA